MKIFDCRLSIKRVNCLENVDLRLSACDGRPACPSQDALSSSRFISRAVGAVVVVNEGSESCFRLLEIFPISSHSGPLLFLDDPSPWEE
jgi:hypothetical protein